MRIAAQMFTLRDFTNSANEIKDSFKKVKDIGYNAIQVSSFKFFDAELIADIAKENGLDIFATHTPYDDIINHTDKVIGNHKLFGAELVGLGWYSMDKLQECKDLLEKLETPVKKITDAGLKFAYHNHAHEFQKDGNITLFDYMAENTDKKAFTFLLDLYWVQKAGLDVIGTLEKYKERIVAVHLKDMKKEADAKNPFCEVFEGIMDYKAIIPACKNLGIEWAAVEQDACDRNPFDSLKISYDNIITKFPDLKGGRK